MAHGLMTWSADGKLQMTSERLTRLHSVYTFNMGNAAYGFPLTVTQPVSGMVNDGTWICLISIQEINYAGTWYFASPSDVKVTINTGYFYVETPDSGITGVIIEVMRI